MSISEAASRAISALEPIDRRMLNDWASAGNVIIPENSPYTQTGPFSNDATRHWIEPMDALTDDSVRDVLVMAPPRSGKNVIADVWLPWIVRNSPWPTQWICSTDLVRDDYKEDRLDRILKRSPASSPFVPSHSGKGRDVKRKIQFTHGMPFYIEGPSDANLQTKGVRYQVRDEVWLWEQKLKEADARLGDFDEQEAAKALTITQGGMEGGALDSLWRECIQYEHAVECQKCGSFFSPVITGYRDDKSRYGFIWDKERAYDKLGNLTLSGVLDSLRYESPCCGHPHIESPRLKANWNRTCKYTVANPDGNPRKRAYHVFATALKKWEIILGNLVAAHNARRRGDVDLLIKFTQKEEARNFSERALASVRQVVIQSGETKKDKAGSIRIATVDVQAEWYWYLARCWEPDGTSRRLRFAKLYTEAEIAELNAELGIESNKCFVDSGYRAKGDTGVYAMSIDYGWIPTKGDDKDFFLHAVKDRRGRVVGRVQKSYAPPTLVDSERGRAGEGDKAKMCYMVRYSTPSVYSKLDGLMRRQFWQEPEADPDNDLDRQYARQMQSTILSQVKGKFKWKTIDSENHAWDLSGMQVLGALLNDILPDAYGSEVA